MRKLSVAHLAAALLVATTVPTFAHHPFVVEFDWKKPVTLTGTVTKFEWTNPHAYLYMDTQDANGKTVNWKLEMGGVGALSSLGWNPKSVTPGATITVDAWQARKEPNFASAKSLRFADGRELYAGSSFFDLQRTAEQGEAIATGGRAGTPAQTKTQPGR